MISWGRCNFATLHSRSDVARLCAHPNACLIPTFERGTCLEYSLKFLFVLCIIHTACQFFPKRFASELQQQLA